MKSQYQLHWTAHQCNRWALPPSRVLFCHFHQGSLPQSLSPLLFLCQLKYKGRQYENYVFCHFFMQLSFEELHEYNNGYSFQCKIQSPKSTLEGILLGPITRSDEREVAPNFSVHSRLLSALSSFLSLFLFSEIFES